MSSNNVVRVSKGRTIPFHFAFLGTLVLALAYIFLARNLTNNYFAILAIVLAPGLPILWTTRMMIEINAGKKYIREYYWLLGFKIGKPSPFEELDYIYVNESKASQRMNSHSGQTFTNRYKEFIGYLKFSNGERQEILRWKNKDYVFTNLEMIADKLDIDFKNNVEDK